MADGKKILFQVIRKSDDVSYFFFALNRKEAAQKFREKTNSGNATKLSIKKVKK